MGSPHSVMDPEIKVIDKNEFSTGKQVKITLRIGSVVIGSNFNKLSHLLTMHPFSTP